MQPRDPPRLRDVALAGLVVVLTTVPSALSLTKVGTGARSRS